MVCAYRARAGRWPKPLFVDPWADALAGPEGHEIARRLEARFPPMELWLVLRVAYLDRPATQAAKRDSLGRLDGYPIDAATYVPCNFEREDPIERLVAAGFLPDEP